MSSNSPMDPRMLEEARPQEKGNYSKHRHPGNQASKRMWQLAQARKRKREAARLQSKLPSVLQNDTASIGKLRKRLIIKNEIIAALAEFCGTFLFLFFAFGIATQAGQQQLSQNSGNGTTQSANVLNTSQLLYSSLGFGFSLAVNAWVFFRVSGGLFNPAVTLGLFLCGAITWYRSIILFLVQFIAGIAAAGIAQLVIPGGINARTRLNSNASLAQGFFIEMFCTSLLMFAIYMLAGEKHKATFIAPVGIGLALFLAELFATGLTGGSLNPARTLGPDVIAATFEASTWIYYTAPFVGTMLSAAVYWALKTSHYETANEGQDGDDTTDALILRDMRGNVTGAVQRVEASQAPEIVPALSTGTPLTGNVEGTSHPPSIITSTAAINSNNNATINASGGDGYASASSIPVAIPYGLRTSFEEKDRTLLHSGQHSYNDDEMERHRQQSSSSGVDQRDFSPKL